MAVHKKIPQPPRWAQQFLKWYCRPDMLEDLHGDLNEYFDRHCKTYGPFKAKLIYVIDVIKFFRSYTVRRPGFLNLLIHWLMLGSYLKISTRSIVKNKFFSAINIIGLAISMSVGLLIIAFLSDLTSYDAFHTNRERIYRVNTAVQRGNNEAHKLATNSVLAGKKIQESISGLESVTLLQRGLSGNAALGEKAVPMSGFWADHSFFSVFGFPLLQGDPSSALKEPYSIVLTESSSKKIFGNDDPLGKYIKFDSTSYLVTGVLKDIPQLSHMRFEALVSFATIELQKSNPDGDLLRWDNIYSTYIYLVKPESTNVSDIQVSLDKISASQNSNLSNAKINLWLQPLTEIPFSGDIGNPIGPSMNKLALWILTGLGLVVILSACFNYTNLSIARSLRRSKEVGIRKVIGAFKTHVFAQFITESIVISLLALMLAFGLFLFLRTEFLALNPYLAELLSLKLSPKLILQFVGLAMVVGLVAGFLPAIFFSRVDAIQVLKNVLTVKVFRHVNLRKALITIQYTFSLIFITTTIIGYNQYKSFVAFDLGFRTENILNVKVNGTDSDQFIKELRELPEVTDVSRSLMVSSLGSVYGMQIKYRDDSTDVWLNYVDENYIPLHKHELLAGKNLTAKPEHAEESEVIVNEQLLKRFEIGNRNPEKALGEQLIIDNKKLTIVGVVKDFHYGTLMNEIQPTVLRYSSNKTYGNVNVLISSKDWPATLSRIENAWKKIEKVRPFEAAFYDDQIEEAYAQFSVMIKVIGFLAFLAICIASLGLLGMVVFTTETRLKEISIRKVLGASEGRLIFLLSKGFLSLLLISALVALPATYLFFENVVLAKFAYHQPIGLMEIIISAVVVMMIAFLLIGSQTLKVARQNPAHVLKSE